MFHLSPMLRKDYVEPYFTEDGASEKTTLPPVTQLIKARARYEPAKKKYVKLLAHLKHSLLAGGINF